MILITGAAMAALFIGIGIGFTLAQATRYTS